ncbi:MAG: hypothetical protein E6R04_01970 [Spirochaetes bacterium]|nr:MAG: hypothetical protein E6R04_01970 [Spirochaetota bacterium]
MNPISKRTKIGEATGLGGAKLLTSKIDKEFDAESMVAGPDEYKPPATTQTSVEMYMRGREDEYSVVGLLKAIESSSGAMNVIVQALLPVILQGCGTLLSEELLLEKMVFNVPDQPAMIWEFEEWTLNSISAREVVGRSAILALAFGKKAKA